MTKWNRPSRSWLTMCKPWCAYGILNFTGERLLMVSHFWDVGGGGAKNDSKNWTTLEKNSQIWSVGWSKIVKRYNCALVCFWNVKVKFVNCQNLPLKSVIKTAIFCPKNTFRTILYAFLQFVLPRRLCGGNESVPFFLPIHYTLAEY